MGEKLKLFSNVLVAEPHSQGGPRPVGYAYSQVYSRIFAAQLNDCMLLGGLLICVKVKGILCIKQLISWLPHVARQLQKAQLSCFLACFDEGSKRGGGGEG